MAKAEVEIKIISRETIKPSSPTPQHLKTFKLSAFDQLSHSQAYPPILLYYPLPDSDLHLQARRLRDLKSSLSQTLTRFYPFAGRIINNEPLVDCNDAGADFIEARVSGRLSDVLENPDPRFLSDLLPCKTLCPENAAAGRVLLVQASLFECGGIAIGVSISHKVADGYSISLLVKGWAARTRGAGDIVEPDLTAIASRFPSVDLPAGPEPDFRTYKPCRTRRFVFDSESIDALKAKATSGSGQKPSRVQVVTGHIWLHMMKLYSRNTKTKSDALVQPMDLRKRIDPPVSENSIGNFTGNSITRVHEKDNKSIELGGLVGELTKQVQNTTRYYAENMKGEEAFSAIYGRVMETAKSFFGHDEEAVMISSWCKFGFYENGDFGWGKPAWVSLVNGVTKNIFILMDTKDGDGVEAWIILEEQDMDLLETTQEFLEFASLNPPIDLQ